MGGWLSGAVPKGPGLGHSPVAPKLVLCDGRAKLLTGGTSNRPQSSLTLRALAVPPKAMTSLQGVCAGQARGSHRSPACPLAPGSLGPVP